MDQALTPPIADDLMIGADVIAEFLYGDAGRTRDVYRNPAGFSFFKHGNSIAARKSTLAAEIAEAERLGRERVRTRGDVEKTPGSTKPPRKRRKTRRATLT